MGGICGQVSFVRDLRDYEKFFYDMQNTLLRRGPDQHGEYISSEAVLMHRRLAVIDIEKGRQPMTYAVGKKVYTICYNGEIFNADEIRSRLESRGYNFFSRSDTEAVLKAYCEYKEGCLSMLNGFFSFAVWEHESRRLFMARDRMGAKPLFYSVCKSGVVFGSEIKALLAHPEIKAETDASSFAEIILLGPGRTPGTGVFKNISELKPASYMIYDSDGMKISKYWTLECKEHRDSFGETAEKVRYLVTDSIRRQLYADVPLGAFLSGGLDSSIIAAVAAEEFKKDGRQLNTFSVDYRGNDRYFRSTDFQPDSDSEYIKIMEQRLNSRHRTIVIDTDELVNALYDAVDARDLPGMADVDSSMLLLCRKVREYAAVSLSGECADEIFGGYPWYRDEKIRMTDGFPWSQSTDYRASFLKDEILADINPQEYVYSRYIKTVNEAPKHINMTATDSRMAEMMKLNLDWFMQTLTDRTDRMSMYSSLEVRMPFCDHRIVEYLYSVPWEIKDYKNREKGLLRYAMKDILPEKIIKRKKSPYPKTHNPAYREKVSAILEDIIADSTSPLLEYIKKEELKKLLDDEKSVPWYGQLMTVPQTTAYFIQINYWLKKYNIHFS